MAESHSRLPKRVQLRGGRKLPLKDDLIDAKFEGYVLKSLFSHRQTCNSPSQCGPSSSAKRTLSTELNFQRFKMRSSVNNLYTCPHRPNDAFYIDQNLRVMCANIADRETQEEGPQIPLSPPPPLIPMEPEDADIEDVRAQEPESAPSPNISFHSLFEMSPFEVFDQDEEATLSFTSIPPQSPDQNRQTICFASNGSGALYAFLIPDSDAVDMDDEEDVSIPVEPIVSSPLIAAPQNSFLPRPFSVLASASSASGSTLYACLQYSITTGQQPSRPAPASSSSSSSSSSFASASASSEDVYVLRSEEFADKPMVFVKASAAFSSVEGHTFPPGLSMPSSSKQAAKIEEISEEEAMEIQSAGKKPEGPTMADVAAMKNAVNNPYLEQEQEPEAEEMAVDSNAEDEKPSMMDNLCSLPDISSRSVSRTTFYLAIVQLTRASCTPLRYELASIQTLKGDTKPVGHATFVHDESGQVSLVVASTSPFLSKEDELQVQKEQEEAKRAEEEEKKKQEVRKSVPRRVDPPYSWSQTGREITVRVPLKKHLPASVSTLRSKDLAVALTREKLSVSIKGHANPVISESFVSAVQIDDSTWQVDGDSVVFYLQKILDSPWMNLFKGHFDVPETKAGSSSAMAMDEDDDGDDISPELLAQVQARLGSWTSDKIVDPRSQLRPSGIVSADLDSDDRSAGGLEGGGSLDSATAGVEELEETLVLLYELSPTRVRVTQARSLASHRLLAANGTHLGVRLDVDMLVFDVQARRSGPSGAVELHLEHVETHSALGYVADGKRLKRLLCFFPYTQLAAIAEHTRLLYVYKEEIAPGTKKSPHQVLDIDSSVLSGQADPSTVVGLNFNNGKHQRLLLLTTDALHVMQ